MNNNDTVIAVNGLMFVSSAFCADQHNGRRVEGFRETSANDTDYRKCPFAIIGKRCSR
jgi:hypothetical protein